jgi:hypothetical protein
MRERIHPNTPLGQEKIDALRAVKLYLGFVTTAEEITDDLPEYTVPDTVDRTEYAAMRRLAEQLDPDTDVLAYRYNKPVGKHGLRELVHGICNQIDHNPTLTPDERQALSYDYPKARRKRPKATSEVGERLATTWQRLAADHIIDPMDTATGFAAMRGVTLWGATADWDEAIAFREQWDRWRVFGRSARNLDKYATGPERALYNNRSLHELGNAALTMNPKTLPTLVFLQGMKHPEDIPASLSKLDIPFTSEVFAITS